jgi:hypothetical protein
MCVCDPSFLFSFLRKKTIVPLAMWKHFMCVYDPSFLFSFFRKKIVPLTNVETPQLDVHIKKRCGGRRKKLWLK